MTHIFVTSQKFNILNWNPICILASGSADCYGIQAEDQRLNGTHCSRTLFTFAPLNLFNEPFEQTTPANNIHLSISNRSNVLPANCRLIKMKIYFVMNEKSNQRFDRGSFILVKCCTAMTDNAFKELRFYHSKHFKTFIKNTKCCVHITTPCRRD